MVAAIALALVPFAYTQAVHNVLEWRLTTQALVNVGRTDLARALGLDMPMTMNEERWLWYYVCQYVLFGGDEAWDWLDHYRTRPTLTRARRPPDSPAS